MIAAAIFDLDGLLVDSEPFWRAAQVEVFATQGLELSLDACAETTGLRIDEVVAYRLANRLSAEGCQQVVDAIVDRVCQLIEAHAEPMPGAIEAVMHCRKAGAKVAVASSSHRVLIEAALRRLSLRAEMDCIASAECESYGKPHPAVFLTTARALGVSPTACVVFEDSIHGVIAAKAARMRCIAVPSVADRMRREFAIADWTLDTLADLGALFEASDGLRFVPRAKD